MTNELAAHTIEDRLREAWPAARLTSDPEPLSGGFWATMYLLSVVGQAPGVPAELVLRIAPDAGMAAKETAVQRVVAEAGYPTPSIRLDGSPDGGLGGSWAVMDLAPGASPLSGLDGAAALAQAPRLFRQLPALLASTMVELHAVDPGRVTDAVRAAAPDAAWTVDSLLGHFEAGAQALGNSELLRSVRRVAEQRPEEGPTVICHGDLHPFNLLVDHDRVTVIDWTAAIRAEPAYDLAFTSLLLANPPLEARGLLGAVVHGAGRSLARRFVASYRRRSDARELGSLDWYRALHGLRILIESESLGDRLAGHPFAMLRPAATSAVASATG